ncbi:hypothetical protein P3W45_000395 [Vairimorpha bombi]
MKNYSTHSVDKKYSLDYQVYITEDNKIISPFHSIDLFQHENENIVTVVNEIPRFENGKFEIAKDTKCNPIKQDTKKNELRFVKNLFPFKGYMWNYGAMPQTWEDKDAICEYTKCKGDNDPLDVLDISSIRKEIGQVYQGKVLGCLAMIDDGECDWKILVIDINDPLAKETNSSEDIEKHFKNYIESTVYWLKNYKVPDGKPVNEFGLDSKLMDQNFAMKIVHEAHNSWKRLISKKHVEGIRYELKDDKEVESDKIVKDNLPEFVKEFYFIK